MPAIPLSLLVANGTITVPAAGPVRSTAIDTVAPSVTAYVGEANCTAASSSTILSWAWTRGPSTAPPPGLLSVSVTNLLPSASGLSARGMVTVRVVWPAAKVMVLSLSV